ncbi:MAG: DNA-processing protein DprA [Propioniciclava sp.]
MSADPERLARMGLACVVEPGDPRLVPLLTEYGAEEVWASMVSPAAPGAWGRRATTVDVKRVVKLTGELGLRFIIPGDQEWPQSVSVLDHGELVQDAGGAPVGLWVGGSHPLSALVSRSVAVVGARACTPYGEQVAADLAASLAERGCTVVSGGAYGIDAAAHRGAVAVRGRTAAVLAGGVDRPYPRAHQELFGTIAELGAVVSEIPPGQHPTRRRFLTRNRLIAALTGGTVIVEAGLRSGARNTVSWAMACGRPVMAVPGSVHSVTSVTPHRLIREGVATLVTTAADVCELLGSPGEGLVDEPTVPHLLDDLAPEQRAVREVLPVRGGRDAGEIAVRSGFSMAACLRTLAELEACGHAEMTSEGRWRLGRIRDRPLAATQGEP